MAKIAYIEDNDIDFLMMKKLLKGHSLDRFRSIADYIGSGQRHDIVISDVVIPNVEPKDFYLLSDRVYNDGSKLVFYSGAQMPRSIAIKNDGVVLKEGGAKNIIDIVNKLHKGIKNGLG